MSVFDCLDVSPRPPQSYEECHVGVCSRLLAEATAPQLALAAGCLEVVCTDVTLPMDLVVYDASGSFSVRVTGARARPRAKVLETRSPLWGPPLSWYVRGLAEQLRATLAKYTKEDTLPLITDAAFLRLEGGEAVVLKCSRCIGCRVESKAGLVGLGAKYYLRALAPLLHAPGAFWSFRVRVRKPLRLLKPWICIEAPSRAIALICLEESCEFEVTPLSEVTLVKGSAASIELTACRPSYLWHLWFYSRVYSNVKALPAEGTFPLYFMGRALPILLEVVSHGEDIEVYVVLSNPSRRAVREVVLSPSHRVVEARVYNYVLRGWEDVVPLYDRVKILIPPLALTHLHMSLKPLPPLLTKRRVDFDFSVQGP